MMAIDDSIPFNIKDEVKVTPMKPGFQIQIDELKNKNDELESEIGALEDKIEILKELVKTMAELI
jgi:FtsZ-binding cell division protein ZapB